MKVLSVLIDTYNHERYIEQAIRSAIEQDFPASEYEIVVIDDGSTDRTPEIVRKFAPRVRLLQKKNGGQASAFNAAFPELRGEIIALLDGDDWFAPGKIPAVMKAFSERPEAAAVGHGYYEHHDDTQEERGWTPDGEQWINLSTPENARAAHRGWRFLLMGAHTVRRKTLERVIPIPEELVFCADGPIIMSSMAGGAYLLPEALSYYRHHAQNLCAVDPKADAERMRKRQLTLERAFEVSERLLREFGVAPDAIGAVLYPDWVPTSRSRLHQFGGSRRETLRTEMRSFRVEYPNATLAYKAFKCLVVGTAAAMLSPRQFYALWNWYGNQKVARFPEPLRRNS